MAGKPFNRDCDGRPLHFTLSAEHILKVPSLATLATGEAASLAEESAVRAYPARDLIAVEGTRACSFYQLLAGRARVYSTGPDGREQVMQLLFPGDTFGEVAVFDLGTHPTSVEAIEDCSVLLIPSASLRRTVRAHPAVAMDLLAHFARRLRSSTELVEQISLQTVEQRVARYVWTSAREDGVETVEGTVVPRTITQQDLASLVGSVREVVSRTMRSLEAHGLIEMRRNEILVRDLAGLERLL